MTEPNLNEWLADAKADPEAHLCGMYLTHNGVVRSVPKKTAREGVEGLDPVEFVDFSYDPALLEAAIAEAKTWPGVHYVRVWLNEGRVPVGGSAGLCTTSPISTSSTTHATKQTLSRVAIT